jgi:DnaJ-class molecular chaperone
LYLEIFVKIPKKLSKNERKFYEELAEEGGMKVDKK